MSVSKRLRFEILRRDNHTCQYCGEKAPDVTLHVDHVKPKALGGSDGPENLVAACKDCNAGKTSSALDAPIVEAIAQRNLDWEIRAAHLAAQMRGTLERDQNYCDEIQEHWGAWLDHLGRVFEMPMGWQASTLTWAGMGVPLEVAKLALDVAMSAARVEDADRFRYFAGVLWRQIKSHEIDFDETDEVNAYTESDMERNWSNGYDAGIARAYRRMPIEQARINPLSVVVDSMTTDYLEQARWVA